MLCRFDGDSRFTGFAIRSCIAAWSPPSRSGLNLVPFSPERHSEGTGNSSAYPAIKESPSLAEESVRGHRFVG